MGNTRPAHVEVTNVERDTKTLRRVWKTDNGLRPAVPTEGTPDELKEATEAAAKVPSFQLHLGSADDDTDEIRDHNTACKDAGKLKEMVPMPSVQVPNWALAHYRNLPLFNHWESSNAIRVSRSA